MTLDLGLLRLDFPNNDPIVPSLITGMGLEDVEPGRKDPISGASQDKRFRRTFAMSFGPAPEKPVAELLEASCQAMVLRSGGTMKSIRDHNANGVPAKIVEFQHPGPDGLPLYSRAMTLCSHNFVQSLMLTALDSPKTKAAVETQFATMLKSLKPGSFFAK
jgi:hypothetical protein